MKSRERWIDYEKLIHWIHRNIIAIIDIILNWLIINFRLITLTFRIVNNLQNLKTEERTKRRNADFSRRTGKSFFLNLPVDLQSLYIRMFDRAILTETRN